MRANELELLATEVRRAARLRPTDLLLGPEIAARIVGPENVLLSDCSVGARLEGKRIVVPENHPDISSAFCHELDEFIIRERKVFAESDEVRERMAKYIAVAIQAPPSAVRRAHKYFGERLSTIARVLGLSKAATHLRLREVLGDEGAVITKRGNVLARNPHRIDWTAPDIAHEPHRAARTLGLRKTSLCGGIDQGRIALRVA